MANVVTVKKKKRGPSTFERLWQRANKQKAANETLRASLDVLIQRVQKEVMPHEKALAESQKPLGIRLLTLGQRKSMTNWERDTLHHWVTEVFEDLREFELIDEDMLNHMARYDAFRMGIELEDGDAPYQELGEKIKQAQEAAQAQHREEARQFEQQEQRERDAMLAAGCERIERSLNNLLGLRPEHDHNKTGDLWAGELDEAIATAQAEYDQKRETLRAEMRQDLEEDIAMLFDEADDEGEFDSLDIAGLSADELDALLNERAEDLFEHFNRNAPAEEKKKDNPLSGDTLQRLFRATAAKLHPDREHNPELRDEKQQLMATLLKARKRGDIITIIDLYKTWVDQHDELSQTDEKALHEALEQWVATLEQEEHEIIAESPMHFHVYKQYHHPSKKKVDLAVKQRIEALSRAVAASEMMGASITSLKSLKPWLENRYEQERWSLGY